MKEKTSRITLTRFTCMATFVVAVLLIGTVTAYSELQRTSGNFTTYFGDGGIFSEMPLLSIVSAIATIPIPFIGIAAGMYTLNNQDDEEQTDKWFTGALIGNLAIFLPTFLIAAYVLLLVLNQI